MIKVSNLFQEESLDYQSTGKYLAERCGEIEDLNDIVWCCMRNDEKLECDVDDLYEREVEPGVRLFEWLFCEAGPENQELRRLLMEMLQTFSDKKESDREIPISMGAREGCAWDEPGYWAYRRKILEKLHKPQEFYDFMKTCFADSEFSTETEDALREIKDFELHTSEIVYNLSLLNDEALDIYRKHREDSNKAMQELASKALDCSSDPKHKNQLKFPFTYETEENGEKCVKIAEIVCSPHMKLIRRDSNLRIYFYWKDARIGNGKKVLIGKIGGHPY